MGERGGDEAAAARLAVGAPHAGTPTLPPLPGLPPPRPTYPLALGVGFDLGLLGRPGGGRAGGVHHAVFCFLWDGGERERVKSGGSVVRGEALLFLAPFIRFVWAYLSVARDGRPASSCAHRHRSVSLPLIACGLGHARARAQEKMARPSSIGMACALVAALHLLLLVVAPAAAFPPPDRQCVPTTYNTTGGRCVCVCVCREGKGEGRESRWTDADSRSPTSPRRPPHSLPHLIPSPPPLPLPAAAPACSTSTSSPTPTTMRAG